MYYHKLILLLGIFCIAITKIVSGQVTDTSFSFHLPNNARTSAGIYKNDGTLVRTLWSGVNYSAGTHKIKWDGFDDSGSLMNQGYYTAKVLSNNVNYEWEGVIGNTSDSMTGTTKHHSLDIINGMTIFGNIAYCGTGYSEGQTSEVKFNLSTPQQRTLILPLSHSTNQSSFYTATDGLNVYWAGNDPFSGNKWFVFASAVSNDTETIFPSGISLQMTYGRSYLSVIDYTNSSSSTITGLAVQKNHNFLFVAHKDLNEVHVLNKTSGALVQTITTLTSPKSMAIDNNDDLWVISSNTTLSKYTINNDGTLSSSTLTIAGLVAPIALAVSPDNSTLVVADGGTSQQLKAYHNNTGGFLWSYGVAGGYTTDPIVTDNKFYFNDLTNDIRNTFICFQPDGSFWVSDPGNFRVQHFSSKRVFIDRIMYLPRNYSLYVDPNNPTRLFVHYLEFSIDYAKPLMPKNGSWRLIKNWRGAIPSNYFNEFTVFKSVTTLNNGKTYGILFNLSNKKPTIVELPSSGPARVTKIELEEYSNKQIYPDGSLRSFSDNGFGGTLTFKKQLLIGFDNLNNPIWDSPTTIASTTATTNKDPVMGGPHNLPAEITSSDIIVSFNGATPPLGGSGYHLGGIRVGDNKWLWKTAQSTHETYIGEYPTDGYYDIGNYSQYSGNVAMAIDRSIFWGYNGEFWKASQTNKWNHVYDNGLFIGQFGTTGPEVSGHDAPPMMAGNAFSPSVIKVGDDYYLYHNDESYHGGVHRWKITGLKTIQEHVIALTDSFKRTSELQSLPGVDLMKGLPFNSVLENNTSGWTRTPAFENNIYFSEWNVKTNMKTYHKQKSPDLWIKYSNSAIPNTVSRDLGTNNNLTSWKLSGKISYEDNMPNTDNIFMYLDILDNADKVLTRFYTTIQFGSPNIISIYANNTLIASGDGTAIQSVTDLLQPIDITMSSEVITVTYAGYPPVNISSYDATGNVKSPKTMRLYFSYNSGGNAYGKFIDLDEMRFTTQENTIDNKAPLCNAGADKTIMLPVSSTGLSGSCSDSDGTISSYKWVQSSGPNTAIFSSSTVAAPTISGLIAGRYAFGLVATDNQQSQSASDEVVVTVTPASTTVVAVYRINAGGGQIINSIGLFSTDNYYSPSPGDTYSTSSAIAGTSDDGIYQSERNGSSGTFSYAFPVSNGQYTVVLHFAEIYYTALNNRIFDVSIEGNKVLDNYDIFKKAGSFTATTESFTVNVTDGSLNIYFSALASDGGKDRAKVSAIEILGKSGNKAPVANAGADKTIMLPVSSTGLSGSGSDSDGTISSYKWVQSSGPNTAIFSSSTVAAPTISGLIAGRYAFGLVATDNQQSQSASDEVVVTVTPASTTVVAVYRINAGGGQIINSIGLFSTDNYYSPSPGDTYSTSSAIAGTSDDGIYQSERNGSSGTFSYAFPVSNGQYTVVLHFAEIYHTALNNRIFDVSIEGNKVLDNYDIFKKAGSFTATTESFTVNVTDGSLNIYFSALASDGGKDRAKVSAIEILGKSGNKAPVANAGADKTIMLPVSSTGLSGSCSDSDGTISSYKWVQSSGPNTAIFSSSTVAAPTISGLIAGRYAFGLVATDNQQSQSASDEVVVTVTPASTTVVAVYRINAGGGQIINSIGLFSTDNYYSPSPGDTYSTSSAIAGTSDDGIYQSERNGSSGTFSYAFPVSNGQYTVVLHFAEIYHTALNNRIFDVSIEGNKVLDNYDIFKKAGSFTATTESFTVNVTDGSLNIYFSALASDGGKDRAKVSAIEILSNTTNQTVGENQNIYRISSQVELLKKFSVTIRPNPSAHYFNFYFTGTEKTVDIKIYSAVGHLIEVQSNVQLTNILKLGNDYLPGLYFAVITQGKSNMTLKFVKQNK